MSIGYCIHKCYDTFLVNTTINRKPLIIHEFPFDWSSQLLHTAMWSHVVQGRGHDDLFHWPEESFTNTSCWIWEHSNLCLCLKYRTFTVWIPLKFHIKQFFIILWTPGFNTNLKALSFKRSDMHFWNATQNPHYHRPLSGLWHYQYCIIWFCIYFPVNHIIVFGPMISCKTYVYLFTYPYLDKLFHVKPWLR